MTRVKTVAAVFVFFIIALVGAVILGNRAASAATNETDITSCVDGWYVNPDETDRKPVSGEDGFTFEPADLMHHETSVKLENLGAGSYVAEPAPDQPSFFSVEVRDDNAYGTLRWDKDAQKWSITIGAGDGPDGPATAGTFTGDNAYELLQDKVTRWGAFDVDTTNVVSFGVGYTKNPPGTVTTVVSSVTFNGETYDLTCKPEETASPSPTAVPTTPAATSAPTDEPTEAPAGDQPTLPKTGVSAPLLGGIGGVLLLAGVGVVFLFRERRRV